jgi:structure-specific endonuclease subunit SLX1
MSWNVYLLQSITGLTYVGATVDLDHRLRQHNGEIKGGAKATSVCPGGWTRVAHIEGFADAAAALQFEWAWKHCCKRAGFKGLMKRMWGLDHLIHKEKATNKAVPFSESNLILVLETKEAEDAWANRFFSFGSEEVPQFFMVIRKDDI